MPPNDIPIATTTAPISTGVRFAPGGWLRSSVIAMIINSSSAVPMV